MRFAEDLGSLVIKCLATNQVKIASKILEIDSLTYKEKATYFLKGKTVSFLITTVYFLQLIQSWKLILFLFLFSYDICFIYMVL